MSAVEENASTSLITQKAVLVVKKGGLGPNFDIGGIIAIISQIFQALSACNPTAAQVHKSITRPGPLQRRAMKRAIRENEPNPALRPHLESNVLQVGASSNVDETSAMYREATGNEVS